ncbi:hypothetical protein GCM10009761_06640 [Agromyces terreus]
MTGVAGRAGLAGRGATQERLETTLPNLAGRGATQERLETTLPGLGAGLETLRSSTGATLRSSTGATLRSSTDVGRR